MVPLPTSHPATPLLAPDLQSLTPGGLGQLRPSRWSAYRTSPHLETRSGPWHVWTGRCSHRWTRAPPYSPPPHRWKTDWARLQIPPSPEHTEQKSTSVMLQWKLAKCDHVSCWCTADCMMYKTTIWLLGMPHDSLIGPREQMQDEAESMKRLL